MIAMLFSNIAAIISHRQQGGAANAHMGSEQAAAIRSTIGTAKLNSVNPEAGLGHVLANISDHRANRVDGFCSALR
jgi:hypothetical protein